MTRRIGRSRARLALAIGALLAAGCETGVGPSEDAPLPPDSDYPLEVRVEQPAERASSIRTTLMNAGPDELGYNLCLGGRLERHTVSGWVAVPPNPTPCPLVLLGLPSGDSAETSVGIPDAATTGTYRLRVELRPIRGPGNVVRRSNAIRIVRGAADRIPGSGE
ncbi:MAG: hypothetical protein R2909_12230 [Gemmatimonadales bacterium]